MAATFNPSLATPKDRIRQRIGDTDPQDAQVDDDTIAAYLGQGRTETGVCYQLALDLAAKWARAGTTTVDDQQQRSEMIYKHYLELARKFEAEMRATPLSPSGTGAIFVGGLDDTRGPIDPPTDYGFVVGIPRTGP